MTDQDERGAAAVHLAMQALALARRDRPDLFINVLDAIPDAIADLRYASADNFVGTRIDGYEAPLCLLVRPAVEALAGVAAEARAEGLRLRLFDCYRPARAVAHFARWASDLADLSTREAYYPGMSKPQLFAEGYIAARSGHSRGATLDLTLVDAATGQDLDMGTPFDLFGPRSWPGSREVAAGQQANRRKLAMLMQRHGFVPFAMEWWHFTLADEPFPETYFDFPLAP